MTSVTNLRERYSHETPTQAAARHAALRGAVSAFPIQPPLHNGSPKSSGTAGALSAASAAGRTAVGLRPTKPSYLSSASYGAVRAHNKSQESLQLQQNSRRTNNPQQQPTRKASPSNIAAVLAAARHSPNPGYHVSTPTYTRPQSTLRSVSTEQLPPGSQSPPSGTVNGVRSWLQQLERDPDQLHTNGDLPRQIAKNAGVYSKVQKQRVPSLGRISAQKLRVPLRDPIHSEKPVPEIMSPRPVRASSVASSMEAFSTRNDASAVTQTLQDSSKPRASISDDERGVRSNAREDPGRAVIPSRTARDPIIKGPAIVSVPSVPISLTAAQARTDDRPVAPPPRRSQPKITTRTVSVENVHNASTPAMEASNPTTKTHSKLDGPPPPPLHRHQTASAITIPKRDLTPTSANTHTNRPMANRKITPTPHMTVDTLANAIVASSLASSRAPSPTKPPLPYRQTQSHAFHLRHPKDHAITRTPSPAKTPGGMRQTMRKEPTSSDEEAMTPHGKHYKSNRVFGIRKHPNKHHEGDRKRWRDEVTERERKRYEGVWAANRGLHLHVSDGDVARNSVCNLVVRDIWRRSRLPDVVLEEVWALVDGGGEGRLGRAEFVVGMWLVDQRLKGRKLPVRVGESVWRSARGVGGVLVHGYGR